MRESWILNKCSFSIELSLPGKQGEVPGLWRTEVFQELWESVAALWLPQN